MCGPSSFPLALQCDGISAKCKQLLDVCVCVHVGLYNARGLCVCACAEMKCAVHTCGCQMKPSDVGDLPQKLFLFFCLLFFFLFLSLRFVVTCTFSCRVCAHVYILVHI